MRCLRLCQNFTVLSIARTANARLVLHAKCDHGHEKGKIRAEERQFRVMDMVNSELVTLPLRTSTIFSSYSNYIFHTN